MSSADEIILKKDENQEKKRKHDDSEKTGKLSKEERKTLKAQKKAEKEELLASVPKVDEDGLTYTALQTKRMMKRVKRGLAPVPTEAEERDRIRRLRAEDKETQDELSGMIFKRKEEKEESADVEEEGDDDDEEEGDDDDDDAIADVEGSDEEESNNKKDESISEIQPPLKKKPRSKPVPDGYKCFACKNAHSPLHWIYDCPDKIRNPGTNKVSKKLRGVHDPSSTKVFLSGLPFEAKSKDVKQYFEKDMKCGKVLDCKLLVFEDTKRCKGTGFLTFESDEAAKKALALNGTPFNMEMDEDKKPKKQLTLNVTKVMNRTKTNMNRTKTRK